MIETGKQNSMNCETALELLASRLATEIEDDHHQQLASHLADCRECRNAELDWQRDDRQLNRELGQKKRTTDGLIASVMDQVHQENSHSGVTASVVSRDAVKTPARRSGTIMTVSLATLVGFLLASAIYRPSTDSPTTGPIVQQDQPPVKAMTVAAEPQIAQLVAATGPIRYRSAATAEWVNVDRANSFSCSAETEIATGPTTRCELLTSEGCVVRLNTNTQLVVETARRVRVQRGQIWCRSEIANGLEVVAESKNPKSFAGPAVYECPLGSVCVLTLDEPSLIAQAEGGLVTLLTDDQKHTIAQGQSVQVTDDGIVRAMTTTDPLIASGWMDSLLVQKGPTHPDLQRRVDTLLAEIGQSKASGLYERELRSLGEHCVLPLTRYVQSELSQSNRSRRLKAMSVVADVSPTWNVKNLIGLLSDDDAEVRVLAAGALQRLTGEASGSSEVWREQPTVGAGQTKAWDNWWDNNGDRFPPLHNATRL